MLNTIYRLFKKKYFLFILLIVMLFAVMGEGYHFLILSNMKSMTVSLNYPGAEQGLNPDGSRFNISEMSDDEILNEAKKGLKIENTDNEKIKSRIFITTKFSQKAMENVVSDIRTRSTVRTLQIQASCILHVVPCRPCHRHETW